MLLTNCVITAYCILSSSTNKCADNKHYPKANHTMAIGDRSTIPLGSKILWNNKVYHGQDRMNRRYDGTHRFDVFFNTLKEARQFGIKTNQTVLVFESK